MAVISEIVKHAKSEGSTPSMLSIDSASWKMNFKLNQEIAQLRQQIEIIPREMNILASLTAKKNLAPCFILRRKPFQALVQNDSPVTAM